MNDAWNTFSHTHRSFDTSETVPQSLRNTLWDQAQSSTDLWQPIFLEDADLIRWIYDQSTIPVIDSYKLPNYIDRKNSQLLAPLLIVLPMIYSSEKSNQLHYETGRVYSSLALTAIQQGWQTGFCICFENNTVGNRLKELGIMRQDVHFGSLPFLSIGHHMPTQPWGWAEDIGIDLKGPLKKIKESYITMT
jgi:hypothetical protein